MVEPMLAAEKMGIFPGSSSTSIFKGNTLAFGMLIPSLTFLEPVFDVFGSGKGGLRLRNVSYISDDRSLTKGICNTIPGFATVNSMDVIDNWSLPAIEFQNNNRMDGIVTTLKER